VPTSENQRAPLPLPFPIPKQTLNQYGLRPKRSFGQNFLADIQLLKRLAQLAGPVPANVVEIGAGLGGLTVALLNRGHHVVAIERDRDLLPVLREVCKPALDAGTLQLLEADAKTVHFEQHLAHPHRPGVVVGNLPYQLTGLLLQKAISAAASLVRAVFLVQLEVADRVVANAGDSNYGALSVFTQAAFQVERAFVVRKGAFYPQPGVDSAVIVLTPHDPPRAIETDPFRRLVKAAFEQRRKTLRNAWKGVLGIDADSLARYAETAHISLDARGEQLSVDDYRRISELIELNAPP
jgi:16S rRNA (adenine1518-N6/adenine1519-N6)-dimethyltransferase